MIALTAAVRLETDGKPARYFIGSKSGEVDVNFEAIKGRWLLWNRRSVRTVGKKTGRDWSVKVGGATVKYRHESVVIGHALSKKEKSRQTLPFAGNY